MKSTKHLAGLCILFVVILMRLSMPVQGEQREQKSSQYTYAMIFPGVSEFFDDVGKGADEAVDSMDADIRLLKEAPYGVDPQIQADLMLDVAGQGVDGIAVAPADSDYLTPYIDLVVEQGIPVICFDTDAPASRRCAFIGTDNYAAGKKVGELLAEQWGEGQILCENGPSSQDGLRLRSEGMRDTLREQGRGLSLVEERNADRDFNSHLHDIEAMIDNHPDFSALVQLDASGAVGADVFKAHGWSTEDRTLIVFDDRKGILEGIENGQIACTVAQSQKVWGRKAVECLYALSQGKTIPEIMYVDFRVIDHDSLNQSGEDS
ncbi:MAG: substrate-binding domain-containing protein [Clostridiales bacterium]|nr:substrate-binding domain-containing protein [Clostridiales bacterium]